MQFFAVYTMFFSYCTAFCTIKLKFHELERWKILLNAKDEGLS